MIAPYTAVTVLNSPRPVRVAFLTHYVGDVRAKNLKLLDQYQLKSLDGLFEVD